MRLTAAGRGGRARRRRRATLHAATVLACDGRRSATARAGGIRYLAWDYPQTGLVCAVEHERPHGGEAHQAFFAGGPFAQLPLPGNRSSIVWSEPRARADAIAGMDDDAYAAEIARRLGGRLGEVRLAGRRWVYPLGLSLATSYARPRLAVAGDAAHGVHPIAGQGLNMGLRDVAALTEVLVEAARRGEDIGAIDVLRRYERWRRFDATAMTLGMDGLNRLFSTGSGPVQALRNAGLHMVVPPRPGAALLHGRGGRSCGRRAPPAGRAAGLIQNSEAERRNRGAWDALGIRARSASCPSDGPASRT